MSCLWQNQHLLTISLSGFVNYLDVNNPSKPLRILKGHNKPITVLTLSEDRQTIYTGSHDGFVTNWNTETGENDRIEGLGHGNQINGIKQNKENLYTCGIDDSVKVINVEGNAYTDQSIKLDSQPRGMDILKEENTVVVGSVNELAVLQNNSKVSTLKVNYEPSSVSVSPRSHVAVGGAMDNKVHIYELKGTTLVPLMELDHLGPVTDVAYSPDDQHLVACDANRKVILYAVPEYKVSVEC